MENKNLWAPWRINYIRTLSESNGCFICDIQKTPQDDDENFVLWRLDKSIVVLNRFPYNNGHLLIAPLRHIPDLQMSSDEELLELMKLVRDCQKALSVAIKPHGFNIGMNFGRCAGAGLPDHLHIHLVPRWDGDTNFMPVCSDTDVISQSMTELLELLKKVSKEHNLPSL
ncbi:MAG: HIT domain-containing protein [Planctomycetes bacterium]|nr:HIT domain-containing protein [Planctomycetota bacterium]